MGFRSTLISENIDISWWPEWFKDKYSEIIGTEGVLRSKHEMKTYRYEQLPNDIQKALMEANPKLLGMEGFTIIWLHECGGITKVQILADEIIAGDPSGWTTYSQEKDGCVSQDGGHNYCYGCSDLRKFKQ